MATRSSHPAISRQPFRFIFQLAYTGTVIARLPIWMIVAALRRLRPNPNWTAKQTFLTRVAYVLCELEGRVGITNRISLEQGKEGFRFQVITPSDEQFYQGPLATSIKPVKVGGTWFPAVPAEVASKTVVYFLHGGAFVRGDGRDDHCGFLARTIIQQAKVDAVFSLQYRLSGYSGLNPFPAALQDALTGYLFLIHELKIPPHQIILAGDSSGGNLAIALSRYLQEHGSKLKIPMPRCMALFSPWVAPLDYDVTRSPNYESDYLGTAFLRWGAHSYAADHPNAALDPYITPLGQPFATPLPIFVNAGSAEIFYHANIRWADEMGKIAGNTVHMNCEEAACHDTILVGEMLGFEKSAEKAASAMGTFIHNS